MDFSREFGQAKATARAEQASQKTRAAAAADEHEQIFRERIEELRACLKFSVGELRKHDVPLTPGVEMWFPRGAYSSMGVFGPRARARVTRECWLIGENLGITPDGGLVLGIGPRALRYEPPRVSAPAMNRLKEKAFAAYAKLGLSEGDTVLGVPAYWGDPGSFPHANIWDPLNLLEDGTLYGKWTGDNGEGTGAPLLSAIVRLVAERCADSEHL